MRSRFLSCSLVALTALGGSVSATLSQDTQPATTQIRGVLLDAEGLPASGFQLGLKGTEGDLFLAPPTGPDGSFALDGVPSGTYRVVAFAPDGAEFPVVGGEVVLEPGRVQRVELRLQPTAHAPGRPPIQAPPQLPRPEGWLSRLWNSGAGGKTAVIAMFAGGAAGAVALLDDENVVSNPSP